MEPLYAESICARAARSLKERYPDAMPRFVELDGADVVDGLVAGRLDVGVASEPSTRSPGVDFEPLGSLGLFLLVPEGHPLARRRPPIATRNLGEHSFILYAPGTEGRRYSDAAMQKLDLSLSVAAEATSALAMRSLVRAGVAPAFVPALGAPRPAKRRQLADGVVEYDLTSLVREIIELPRYGLLTRSDLRWHGALEAFAEIVRKGSGGTPLEPSQPGNS